MAFLTIVKPDTDNLSHDLLLMAEYYQIPLYSDHVGELSKIYNAVGHSRFTILTSTVLWDWSGTFGVATNEDYSWFILLVREAIK